MTDTIQFSSIKEELNKTCEQIINKHLEGKTYNQKRGTKLDQHNF